MVGDRYAIDGFVIEQISDDRPKHRVVANPENVYNYHVGMLGTWSGTSWKLQQDKSDNFKNLYEKLL